MVRKLSISPEESVLSLPIREEEREVKDSEFLGSNYPAWSSRSKCLQAYVCVALSFLTTIEHCKTIGTYGTFAFIAYIILAIVIGVPSVLLEVMIGRYVMGNVTKAWSMCPIAKGVLLCLFVSSAYTIIMNNACNVYLLKYMFALYHGYIEWDDCRQPWAKENCFVTGKNTTFFLKCVSKHSESYCKKLKWESAGTQYWNYVGNNSNSVHEICSSLACLAISVGLLVLINFRGHQGCEKAFVILVYMPILVSFILAYVSYNSSGALSGVILFFQIDWHQIYDWKLWLTVLEDLILSLGLGTLSLSFVSSHGRFRDNIFIDVFVVIFTSTFSPTLMVFPLLSVIAAVKNLPSNWEIFSEEDSTLSAVTTASDSVLFCVVSTLLSSRISLFPQVVRMLDIFVWVSEALVHYPYPNVFWTFLFFLEMLLLSFGNQAIMFLAFCEAVWAIFSEKNKFLCNLIVVAVMSFALTIPYLFIGFNFEFHLGTSAITILLLFAITLQIFYGYKRFIDDYHFMLGYSPSFFFLQLYWISTIPTLLVVLGTKMYYKNPDKPLKYIVYIYIAIPLVLYLFVAVAQVIQAAKQGQIGSAFMADPNWGPTNSILKMSRLIFNTRTITKEFLYRQELYRKPLMKLPDFSHQNIAQLL